MPRPKSGQPPWKPLAVKLPPALLTDVLRYAELRGTTPSVLLRDELTRLVYGPPAPEAAVSLTPEVLIHLTQTLTQAATALQQLCQRAGVSFSVNGNTLTDSIEDNGNTQTGTDAAITVNGNAEMGVTPTLAPDCPPYDMAKYVLGKLCKRGHEHGTTGRSLLLKGNRACRKCDIERQRERRVARRTAG
jgi:hypothetical protein